MTQSDKTAAKTTDKAASKASVKSGSKNSGKSAKSPSIFARFGRYLKDVRTELRRVIWPTRQDVINSSIVVIITLLFFIVFTSIIDNIASYIFIDVLAGIGR